uniref:Endonuclease NucS n=1 Tax=Thermofilum pendens TaxID=2269 RepID=A0A7C1T1T8_THEPE
MQAAEAASVVSAALAKKCVVLMVATCSVEYDGRARSRLGDGDRVIVIKPDGAVLVHRPYGSLPVNYQPEGSAVSVRAEGDSLVITAVRSRPAERLTIRVRRIAHLVVAELRDDAEFEMWGSEEELRDAIALNPELLLGEKLNPVDVEARLGRAGFADLLMVDDAGNYVVVEVKREEAGVDAVFQLKRYVSYVQKALGRRVRGILAAPSISKRALSLLAKEGLEFRRVDPRAAAKAKSGLLSFISGEEQGGA